ncbi:hypothetical protein D0Y65_030567 [Glycine soja]|uniref:Replication protein A 70 kDa DNA-binding subunit B/D first OB fold domain-containing protein n=1 Tax=Glycine soja TaxID=3848 RepID=A0A445I4Q2_GLYSO|nr:hypothetical protein D0Y65_030567 [Glycine soja]
MLDNLNGILQFDYLLYKGSFYKCQINNLTLLSLFCRLKSIAEIDDQKETCKIIVRVINMWTIPRSPKSIVELILVDKKGDKILAQMRNVDVQLDNVIFDVGHTYVIKNFEVEKNSDRFLHNAQVKCFDELSQLKKECMCVTVATLSKLLVANGWIYDGCPKCNKKDDGEGSSLFCVECGNKSASTVAKFCVDVRVGQPNEYAIFTLWDRECYALIKETADEIKQKMINEVKNIDTESVYSFWMDSIVMKNTTQLPSKHLCAKVMAVSGYVNPSEGYYSFYYLLGCEGSSQ